LAFCQCETAILLNLWNLGGLEKQVNKRDLTTEVKLSQERLEDYEQTYEQLEKIGAIAVIKQSITFQVLLTNKGLQILDRALKNSNFQYLPEQQVRAKDLIQLIGGEITAITPWTLAKIKN
jgi:hypothetical protein